MDSRKSRYFYLITILFISSYACSAGGNADQPVSPTSTAPEGPGEGLTLEPPTQTSSNLAQELTQTTQPDAIATALSSKNCLITANLVAVTDADKGFCFLYPNDHTLEESDFGVRVIAPIPPNSVEYIPGTITIENLGSAGGLTTQLFADQRIAFLSNTEFPPTTSSKVINEQNAVLAEGVGLPGIFGTKEMFVVNNGYAYRFSMHPEGQQNAEDLWTTLLNSFKFLELSPPQVQEDCVNDSAFVSDVTLLDGTLISPGTTTMKVWEMKNDGTCSWNVGYSIIQTNPNNGFLIANPIVVGVPHEVLPGENANIAVFVKLSPSPSIGSQYKAQFQMQTADHQLFGSTPFALVTALTGNGVCPPAFANLVPLIDIADNYCLLHPNNFTPNLTPSGMQGGVLTGPAPSSSGESAVVSLSVEKIGNVGGKTSQLFASEQIAIMQASGSPPSTSTVTLGGYSAVAAEGLPGILGTRIVFVVFDSTGYILTLFPIDNSVPTQTAKAEAFWTVILDSFSFFFTP